jgi:hypothetical protein
MLALAWVLHAVFGPRAHIPLASLSVNLGFDALASLPLRRMGQETSRWQW